MMTITKKKLAAMMKGQDVVDQWHPETTYRLTASCGLELRNLFKTSHEVAEVTTDHENQATLFYGPGLRMFVALTDKEMIPVKEKREKESFGVRLIFDLPRR